MPTNWDPHNLNSSNKKWDVVYRAEELTLMSFSAISKIHYQTKPLVIEKTQCWLQLSSCLVRSSPHQVDFLTLCMPCVESWKWRCQVCTLPVAYGRKVSLPVPTKIVSLEKNHWEPKISMHCGIMAQILLYYPNPASTMLIFTTSSYIQQKPHLQAMISLPHGIKC